MAANCRAALLICIVSVDPANDIVGDWVAAGLFCIVSVDPLDDTVGDWVAGGLVNLSSI